MANKRLKQRTWRSVQLQSCNWITVTQPGQLVTITVKAKNNDNIKRARESERERASNGNVLKRIPIGKTEKLKKLWKIINNKHDLRQ